MKSPTPAELQDQMASLYYVDDTPELTPVDRSTLERYATCPAQGRFVETGRVLIQNRLMAAGEEVHRVLGEVTANWIRSGMAMGPPDMRQAVDEGLRGARPDVQPEAIRGMRASVWAWVEYIRELHPDNILKFDGGEGAKSGQLARELPGLGLLPTSELDLLHAVKASKQVLREVDYKAGHKLHNRQEVHDSFQFQFHWWLVAGNFENIEALEVVVWNTRLNRRQWVVEFDRRDLPAIEARVHYAAGKYWQAQQLAPEQCETWPGVEKCPECPAALVCPAYVPELDLLSKTPEELVDLLPALNAKITAAESLLTRCCRERGSDIVSASGNAWGLNKPKRAMPAKCGLYQLSSNGSQDQEESEDA